MRGTTQGVREVFTSFGGREWLGTALGAAALVVAMVAALKSDVAAGIIAALALVLLVGVTLYALSVRERYGGIYEIVTSELEWDLTAADGREAFVTKKNKVRFIQNNVLAIPDYIWGDGSTKSEYSCNVGQKVAEFQEGAKTCVVIVLDRMYKRDEELELEIKRTVRDAFMGTREWIEVKPLAGTPELTLNVLWPAGRSAERAELTIENERRNRRSVEQLGDDSFHWGPGGRQQITRHFARPSPDERIRIEWSWTDSRQAPPRVS